MYDIIQNNFEALAQVESTNKHLKLICAEAEILKLQQITILTDTVLTGL